ncbi:MAG: DUF3990 domain-containing protein [Oscillospiraceae bacterium]|nr:DUF3990 domain-containing protein [Oscillospiraceae bacterium]MBR2421306.1 DUF3990 domain-containing protein [Oscillospiraceae bacterium]
MQLYHGSNIIVKEPMIVKTTYTKDFSWGFYTTTNLNQAEKWARRRAQRFGGYPCISVYEFTPDSDLNIIEFETTTNEWLDMIAHCRAGGTHLYDVVSGPMADDEIWNMVEDFLSGAISREEFLSVAKFRHPTHQMSFHTILALSRLSFQGGDRI